MAQLPSLEKLGVLPHPWLHCGDATELFGDLRARSWNIAVVEPEEESRRSGCQHAADPNGHLALRIEVHPWDAPLELLDLCQRLIDVMAQLPPLARVMAWFEAPAG